MKEFKLGIWLFSLVAVVSLTAIAFALTSDSDKNQKKAKKGKKEEATEMKDSPCIKGEFEIQQQWQLPSELKEVSAIAYLDDRRIAAVQDQKGTIYIYNLTTSRVEEKINFGPDGDYEGLVHYNSSFYIMRSDGQLTHADANGKIIKVHQLPLSEVDNIESLCLDQKNNRLLLAQKDGAKDHQKKKIFAFDLKKGIFISKPVIEIDFQQILTSCGSNKTDGDKGKKSKKSGDVRPSEMIIDPKSGDLLIADGPSSRIFVFNPDGNFKHICSLDKKQFPQAEGLSFSPSGELYVATEGIKDPAMIAKGKF